REWLQFSGERDGFAARLTLRLATFIKPRALSTESDGLARELEADPHLGEPGLRVGRGPHCVRPAAGRPFQPCPAPFHAPAVSSLACPLPLPPPPPSPGSGGVPSGDRPPPGPRPGPPPGGPVFSSWAPPGAAGGGSLPR